MAAMEEHNRKPRPRSSTTILDSSGFYRNPVAQEDRSLMNVPFRLKDEALDEAFLKGAQARGMIQLKGHRSVGGMRASIYNAMPIEGVQALVEYMKEFERPTWLSSHHSNVLVLNQISPAACSGCRRNATAPARTSPSPTRSWCARPTCTARTSRRACRRSRRAGAGTNNIPVEAMSARGVPVFNAPGANANAVKELVLAGMLMAARTPGAGAALRRGARSGRRATWTRRSRTARRLSPASSSPASTLGVIGLGKIGCLVADAAIKLGMQVLGHDPEITVDAAWSLPAQVKRATSVNDVLKARAFRHAARAAGGGHAPPGQREEHRR